MDIYYHKDLNYVKLAKYRLCTLSPKHGLKTDSDLAAYPIYIDIVENKTVALAQGDIRISLKLPDYIQSLLISLLRDHTCSQSFKIKLTLDKNVVWCRFYLNTQYISDICAQYGLAPNILSMLIRACSTKASFCNKYDDTEIPVFRNESQIWSLSYDRYLKIKPYDYQNNNIQWLMAAEDAISRQERYIEYIRTTDLLHFKHKTLDYYLDPNTSIIYDHDSIWNCKFRCQKYTLHGGVLCDEVGLGKTLSMTGLILGDKINRTKPPEPAPAPVQTPVVKIKAKVRPKADEPAIKIEEPVTITVKKKIIAVAKKPPPVVPADIGDDNGDKVPTPTPTSTPKEMVNTTLVMCPRRLVSQWITEIQKYTSHLRVIEMSTLTHIKSRSCLDGVDVVVASFSLFDNKNYLSQDIFRLDQVYWQRVIVDEGHEVLLQKDKKRAADLRISTAIFSIKSKYRWICTGTPLPSTAASLQAILSYLAGLEHNQLSPILDNIEYEDYKRLMEMVFHRNTRNSIKEQVTIPKHREFVEFLEFTKTERAIYDSVNPIDTTRQLQVCTNLSVSDTDNEIIGGNILDLSQVTKAMGAYYMQSCDRTEQLIADDLNKIQETEDDIEISISEIEAERATAPDPNRDYKAEINRIRTNARNRIKTLNEHISKHRDDLVEYRKQLQTFRSLDLAHIGKSTCPIYGTKLQGKVAISPDGYYYSMAGIELLFLGGRKVAKCACTRKPIELDSLIFVDTSASSNEPQEVVDLERSKWGTKMSHVVNKLRSLFAEDHEAKVIIFSQWQRMLMLMAKALKDCNINYVFCRGNVHMMSKSIRSFKGDPKTRVILLSSDSCNSGSNLTEASYVYLIDAVSGDIEHARAAETQAIARTCRIGQTKEVQVYRFVIRDTIEEQYYKLLN